MGFCPQQVLSAIPFSLRFSPASSLSFPTGYSPSQTAPVWYSPQPAWWLSGLQQEHLLPFFFSGPWCSELFLTLSHPHSLISQSCCAGFCTCLANFHQGTTKAWSKSSATRNRGSIWGLARITCIQHRCSPQPIPHRSLHPNHHHLATYTQNNLRVCSDYF